MAPNSRPPASVLIVDADIGIRRLLAAVLEHAGFQTAAAADFESVTPLVETSEFAVILRDLNMTPGASRRSLAQLVATAPELLRRTVVMTTTPVFAATSIRAGTVFAVVGKPFDIDELVNAVSECARHSQPADRLAAKHAPSSDVSRGADADTDSSMQLESLNRFVTTVPSLQRLLSVPVRCEREAALRAEMRRRLGTLSATLMEAACVEASTTQAAVFRAASTVAARLATGAAAAVRTGTTSRDH